jgi:uncharacterized protein YceK
VSSGTNPGRAAGSTTKGRVIVTLAGPVLAVAVLTGCASVFHHAASPAASPATRAPATRNATAAAQVQLRQACSAQTAWDRRGQPSLHALYADTGALAADASAGNQPAVATAGRKLASDAIAAAALPLPPIDPASWQALTADYATAGTAIGGGDASGAVPQLEAGNGAISAFSSAAGKCSGLKP